MANDVNCKHYDSINGWCEKLSYFGYPKRIEYCPKSPCEYAEPIEQVANDNDIIKALGFCESPDCECTGECPMFRNGINSISDCRGELHKNALALINRQKAEVESFKLIISTYEAETKRVRDIAIEEVGEKLKSHKRRMCGNDNSGLYWDQAVLVDDIDRVMKELTEEKG